jgi:iron(III) transport system ATP-binding protein
VLERGRLVQAGTPEEVYTRPATRFVARFTGLAGELRARVRERRQDGTVLVEPMLTGASASPFLARAAVACDGAAPDGDRTLVMIRPAGVRLCANGTDDVHLTGRIADVAFRGRGYEYAVDVDDDTRLTGVLADVRAPRGQTVGLRLDPAGCHAFPPEP